MSLTQDNFQLASNAFQNAKFYDKARSGYDAKIVQNFLEKLEVFDQPTSTSILELAAGSGQFTKAITEATEGCNIRLIASEPLETMSHVLKQNNPGVEYIHCRAENIPLPDNSVNVVVAANAVHFFSNAKSYAEICRVLVPGGMLGIFTKSPNTQAIPWALEILQDASMGYQKVGVSSDTDGNGEDLGFGPGLQETGLFEDVQTMTVEETDAMDEIGAIEHFMSYGGLNVNCDSINKEKIRHKVEKLVRSNYSQAGKEMSDLPFKSFLYWTRKK